MEVVRGLGPTRSTSCFRMLSETSSRRKAPSRPPRARGSPPPGRSPPGRRTGRGAAGRGSRAGHGPVTRRGRGLGRTRDRPIEELDPCARDAGDLMRTATAPLLVVVLLPCRPATNERMSGVGGIGWARWSAARRSVRRRGGRGGCAGVRQHLGGDYMAQKARGAAPWRADPYPQTRTRRPVPTVRIDLAAGATRAEVELRAADEGRRWSQVGAVRSRNRTSPRHARRSSGAAGRPGPGRAPTERRAG